jgi:hypothetical protein
MEPMETGSDRIPRMKAASRLRGQDPPPCPYERHLAEAHERHAHLPWRTRQAKARAFALANLPVYLFPEERLVGMVYHCGPSSAKPSPTEYGVFGAARVREELPDSQELVDLGMIREGASPGHVTWRWDWILRRGVAGLLEEYRRALSHPRDGAAREFYQGVILSLEALLRWNERHVEAMREKLVGARGDEEERLRGMIAVCERVPRHPARTFHEAVQGFWFQHLADSTISSGPISGRTWRRAASPSRAPAS